MKTNSIIICPYCEAEDLEQMLATKVKVIGCKNCSKDFVAYKDVAVTYTTKKIVEEEV